MPNFIYVIWSLLPLAFLLLAAWALIKRIAKIPGREFGVNYLAQALFCAIGLAAAIYIDQTEWFEDVLEKFSFGSFDLSVARILLYPAVLLLIAQAQQFWKKEGKKK